MGVSFFDPSVLERYHITSVTRSLVRTGKPSVGGPRPTEAWKILSPNRVGRMSLSVPLITET